MTDKYYLRSEGSAIFLCCGKAGCPSLSPTKDGMVSIKDDNGNEVKLKVEEAEMLGKAVEALTENPEGIKAGSDQDLSGKDLAPDK